MPGSEDRATPPPSHAERALSPGGWLRGEHRTDVAEGGIALCLSGGGYRAMLFHVGSLWRLNEAGLLPALKCISSVSGGSITAAVLGSNWGALNFGSDRVAAGFTDRVVAPVRALARHTIDVGSILGG